MPLCAAPCHCKYCKMDQIINLPQFKERVEKLIAEYDTMMNTTAAGGSNITATNTAATYNDNSVRFNNNISHRNSTSNH